MASLDYIYHIAEICSILGIENAIICPGSRSAPLTLSFAKHPNITCRLVFDERSAGYIALGIAQATNKPVVLICTSGTAALNFAPAVAEAFWQQIPLLVLTGDRPSEWIGQGDGQTIYQNHIYKDNCKKSYVLSSERLQKDEIWNFHKIVSEAIYKTTEEPKGPVHINIPSKEPFYPSEDKQLMPLETSKIAQGLTSKLILDNTQWESIIKMLAENPKRLIVAGHLLPDSELEIAFNTFNESYKIPFLADVNSNLMGVEGAIVHYDLLISTLEPEELDNFRPEFLISFGNEFVSKSLKQFLRASKPKIHLHISENDHWVDAFQSVTHYIKVAPQYFFSELFRKTVIQSNTKYLKIWQKKENLIKAAISVFESQNEYSELAVANLLIKNLPKDSIIHLSNSLPVRYANMLGISESEVYCNRGTSGIDGCVSTSVGFAMSTKQIVTLFVGDVAFLYDRNAFWHDYLPANLRIVVINNGGGQIFRTIEGAKDQPELNDFFVGRQNKSMESVAIEYDIEYHKVMNMKELELTFLSFYKMNGKSKLIEIVVDGNEALNSLGQFKTLIKGEITNS